ncbi:trypsin-like serine protease [Saccharothrix syringae]|uniref:Trypsin-like serine protease n=1 Tax=Saccharothrix syringae TaxID=103733 RepID=A0A5Q0GZ70_SACSY|nr:trypsin-like serine protease [Saccharothrix syringae]QFZ19238.1 trypsin-like serine protease [Saccharothrix syringae]
MKRPRPGAASLAAAAVLLPLLVAAAPGHAPAANYEGGTVPAGADAGPSFHNGQPATVDEFPAVIAGLREGGTRPRGQSCTGSVIAPRKVLIAAHCADAAGEKSFLYGLDDLDAGGGFRTAVVEYAKHPRYVNFDQGYDVAVVTVADDIPVPGGRYARFATSADAGLVTPGDNGLGFGYGKKEFDDSSRDVTLAKATLPVVDGDRVCQGVGAGFKSATMICAGYADGRTAILPGDSGGPLVVAGKVVGVASWSRSDFKWYSVYARLTNDMGDWVARQVGDSTVGVSPAGVTAPAGGHVSTTVTTAAGPTGPEQATLSASGLPAGVRALFQPAAVRTGSNAKLTFEVAATAPSGTHPITVTATTASGRTGTAPVTLTVRGQNPGDVAVTANPSSASVSQGFFARFTVGASGGAGDLALSATGLPAGATIRFSPPAVTPGGSGTALLWTGFQTPPGTYPVVIRATAADGRTGTATFTLTVTGWGTSGRGVA